MAIYDAVLMHGERGGEGHHKFEAAGDLMSHSPITVMKVFMAFVDETAGLGHVDFHINAAMRNDKYGVVTVLGDLIFHHDGTDDPQPFCCMISKAKD